MASRDGVQEAAVAERFNYVVAHPWPSGNLAIYAFGSEVQQSGTIEEANGFLDYVKRQSPDEAWAVYRVDFTPIDGAAPSDGGRKPLTKDEALALCEYQDKGARAAWFHGFRAAEHEHGIDGLKRLDTAGAAASGSNTELRQTPVGGQRGLKLTRACGSYECKAAQRDGVICADDECRDADTNDVAMHHAYEVVRFRLRLGDPENWLRTPVGTAEQFVPPELITSIEPAREVQCRKGQS